MRSLSKNMTAPGAASSTQKSLMRAARAAQSRWLMMLKSGCHDSSGIARAELHRAMAKGPGNEESLHAGVPAGSGSAEPPGSTGQGEL